MIKGDLQTRCKVVAMVVVDFIYRVRIGIRKWREGETR